MKRKVAKSGVRQLVARRHRLRASFLRPLCESLEDRLMLDNGAANQPAPSIVVGRTLSAYFVSDVQNHAETITYTVYNEQSDPVTGVLLTTTLAPGITIAGSSQQPDENGQKLSWSLGTIDGFSRASVSVTVNLTTPTPLVLDNGATAFGTLDAGMAQASTPAAALNPGIEPAGLLVSTPDADTTDPFIQEMAAQLDYSAQNIFNFLHDQIGYNSYEGSIRGARGTLWSSAGNSLDVASLGVALLRASGIPAQYAQGTLTQAQAQELILTMFPASAQTVGYVSSGTAVGDPASDPQLLAEADQHYWLQFDSGGVMTNADPLMPGATIGASFATSTGTFAQIAAALEATTEIQIVAEIDNTADSLFGLSGIADTTVLDQTFVDVALVGRTISVGQFVTTSGLGALISSTTNTYTPYLQIGDAANPDPTQDTLISGQPFQEVLTNFPFGSQVVTGVFLNVSVNDPGEAAQSYQYTIADRIGIAARESGGSSSISVAPGSAPLLSPDQVTTVEVLPGEIDPDVLGSLANAADSLMASYASLLASQALPSSSASLDSLDSDAATLFESTLIATTSERLAEFFALSQTYTDLFSQNLDVKAYYNSPRIAIMSLSATPNSGGSMLSLATSFDITKDDIRVVVAPGQNTAASVALNLVRGPLDTSVETTAGTITTSTPNLQTGTPVSASTIVEQAQAQGIPLVTLFPGQQSRLDALTIPAAASTLISQELASGMIVITPAQGIQIDGVARLGWYEVDPHTGQSIGVLDNGTHGFVEDVASYLFNVIQRNQAQFFYGVLVGWGVDTFAGLVRELISITLAAKLPENLAKGFEKSKAFFDVFLIYQAAQEEANILYLSMPAFAAGLALGLGWGLKALVQDPPITNALVDPAAPAIPIGNQVDASVQESSSLAVGAVSSSVNTTSAQATGAIQATWSTSSSSSGFLASALSAAIGQVKDANGNIVGSGAVLLASPSETAIAISGNASFSVNGTGSVSFYGPAQTSLGASGNWKNYSANVTGNLVITITTGSLSLNGTALSAGTYTIITSAAMLNGSGSSTSPDFSGSASLSVTGGTVALGSGSGNVAAGGKPLDPSSGVTFTGFTGGLSVSANGNATDTVKLSGSATGVMRVVAQYIATPVGLTTDQNSPVTFQANVLSSLTDSYTITALAPSGWTLSISSTGLVTATPAPGTQGGSFPIRIIAQSTTNPDLVAQSVVDVAVTPTTAGITLNVAPDPIFTLPFDGAQLPSAFRATIQNLGPAADTFNLTFSNVPAGFSVISSSTSLMIPAGETGIAGIYLVPTGQIPAPNTQVSLTITATSASDPSITETQSETFTFPAIDALTLSSNPRLVNTVPGLGVTDTITVTNAGNVALTDITLSDTLPSDLSLTGLAPFSLAAGASTTVTVTLTPDASTALGTELDATITATYGPQGSPSTQTLTIPVNVVVPGAAAIANASTAAAQLGNSALAARLNDLSTALSNLVQSPTSAVYASEAQASLSAVTGLLSTEPGLSSLGSTLSADGAALAQATTTSAVQTAVVTLGNDLGTLGSTLTDLAAHQFQLSFTLMGNSEIGRPQVATTYQLVLRNTGSQTTTYDLSLGALPTGVTGSLSQSTIMLAPGQVSPGSAGVPSLIITIMSTSPTVLSPFNFTVTASAATAPEISQTITGSFAVRQALVQVTSVTTNPTFTEPGGSVDVSARILNAVNTQQQALVSYTVTDGSSNVLFTSTPVATTLNVLTTLSTVDLGNLDTTGFALGEDTITVTVTDSSGNAIPGATGTGTILIGTPVTATLSTTPTSLPAGTGTVTTTLQINSQTSFTSPLALVGETSISGSSGVAVNGSLAYVGQSGGINVVDVSNPTTPKIVSTFGANDFPGMSVVDLEVHDGDLVVLAQSSAGDSQSLLIYSLANASSPTLVGHTPLSFQGSNDSRLAGFTISNNHVYTDAFWYRYTISSNQIFAQFGEAIDVDISNPANPTVVTQIYNDPPDSTTGYPDGTSNIWQGAVVNQDVLLLASTTATGSTLDSSVQGVVMVVDTTDPANPSLLEKLVIPGMAGVTGISVQGDQAFVIGSSQYWGSASSGLEGHVVVAMLDLSNPEAPKVISSQTLNVASIGMGFVQSLGNSMYVTDSLAGANQAPELLVFDASDPLNVNVTQVSVPNNVAGGLVASGSLLFAADGSSLSIYNIGSGQDTPVTAKVTVPSSGVSIVPGSFNLAPNSTTTNADGSQTLEWDLGLSAGTTSQTITWQSTVTGLQPGQSVTVADDATVEFTTAPQDTQSVSLTGVVNANLQTYSGGTNYPVGGTQLNVGGVPFVLASYPGGGTGVVQTQAATQATPSVFDVPVNAESASTVYTLINSGYGTLNNLDGTVEFFGTTGAYAIFYLVEGQNIRDHYNNVFNNQIAPGTPSASFGGGSDRLDRQTFVLPSSFAGQTLTDIRLSGFGDNPTGEPFLAAVTVASAPSQHTATDTLSLPDQIVAGQEILGISPATQTVAPTAPASYDVSLLNPTSSPVTYSLSVQGVPAGWVGLQTSVIVGANQTVDVPLVLNSDAFAGGTYAFTVSASGNDGATSSVGASLALQGQPVVDSSAHGVVATLISTSATAGQGTSAQYVVRLTNTGSAGDTFSLAAAGLPAGVTASFSEPEITVPAGIGNFRNITLTLTAATGTSPGNDPFTVTAASTTHPATTSAADGTLSVVAGGVQVALNPGSGAPGTSFRATVTNTGTTSDTFDLTLGGPAAISASLALGQVTLAPGASQVVPINTAAVDIVLPGLLGLTALATSSTDPAIRAAATADLSFPALQNVTAVFSPASQTLSQPGKATFFLTVQNAGTAQDSYVATIIRTTGGVSASLIGLDGLPAQSVSGFILPALSSGTIELDALLSAAGQGTVTVEIQSMSDPSIVAVATASLGTPATVSADGPRVTQVQRFGYHMMQTSLVLTFDEALDPTTALKKSNYRIIGPEGRSIGIKSVRYNAANHTVTLVPVTRINIHHRYQLIVKGVRPGEISNTLGQLLDGNDKGVPGSNYRAPITWRNLVLPTPLPRPTRKAEAAHAGVHQVKATPAHHASPKHGLFTRSTSLHR